MKQLNFPVKIQNIKEDLWNRLWNDESLQTDTFAKGFSQPATSARDAAGEHFISRHFKSLGNKKCA